MSFQHDTRVCIYPNYIDSKKTVAEGRRIPKPKACENPNVKEIFDCCKYLKVPAEIEEKCYPRDWWIYGRVRVQLKKDDGSPINPELPTRRALLIRIAELVPKHPDRNKKPSAQQSKPEASGSSKPVATGKSNKKKKK